jgi:hypothetical protein
MKLSIILLFAVAFAVRQPLYAQTWAEWFKQKKTQKKYLGLQIAKLQVYLGLLKDGYRLAGDGLGVYHDIKNGDWQQHLAFFGHQQAVSRAVRDYPKVPAILAAVKQANASFDSIHPKLRASPELKVHYDEIMQVFSGLRDDMTTEVQSLNQVLTDKAFTMTDQQRMEAIDRIHLQVTTAAGAVQQLVLDCLMMEQVRQQEARDLQRMQGWRRR